MKRVFFFLLLCIHLQLSWSQEPPISAKDTGPVPMEYIKNAVFIPVIIKGNEYRFVVDTGGGMMISSALRSEVQAETVGSITVSDINKNELEFERVNMEAITIGNRIFEDILALVEPFSEQYPNSCFEADGMIGRDLFGEEIIQFDHENGTFRICNDPALLNLKQDERTKLKFGKTGLPQVLTRINGKKRRVVFDSGSSDFFSFKTDEHNGTENEERVAGYEGVFSFGVSSVRPVSSKRFRTQVSTLDLAGTVFRNFYSDLSKPTRARLGAGILPYGKTSLDYMNGYFYFESYNKDPKTEFADFGFAVALIEGKYVIKWIRKGSMAESQGIAPFDVVVSINGQSPEKLDACKTYLNGYPYEASENVELTIRTASGSLKSVRLNKEKL